MLRLIGAIVFSGPSKLCDPSRGRNGVIMAMGVLTLSVCLVQFLLAKFYIYI